MRRPYPNYQDSGVKWLGEVPEHWLMTRLRFLANISTGDADTVDAEEDGEYPFFVRSPDVRSISSFCYDGEAVLLAGDGNVEDTIHHYIGKYDCHQRVYQLNRLTSVDGRFLYHYMKVCFRSWITDGTAKSTVESLRMPMLQNFPVALPSLLEQHFIAAFLDTETAEIDTLISKKRLLLDRLAEFRTALITRTVTKGLPPAAARQAGLNPAPPLKASGVEWLGDIPEHWELVKNRRLFSERDERSDDGVGELLTVSHITGVTRRSEKPDVGMFMAESLVDYKCCLPGDLIINTMWAWMGAAGTAKEPGLVSPSYNVYMPDSQRLIPRFVDIAYRSLRYVLGMTSESRGIWSSRLRLYPQHFLSLVTAVPPLQEQEAIIAYVDAIETRSERLSATIRMAIERLQEYRTALITAAVTGKIDVRDREMVETGASV